MDASWTPLEDRKAGMVAISVAALVRGNGADPNSFPVACESLVNCVAYVITRKLVPLGVAGAFFRGSSGSDSHSQSHSGPTKNSLGLSSKLKFNSRGTKSNIGTTSIIPQPGYASYAFGLGGSGGPVPVDFDDGAAWERGLGLGGGARGGEERKVSFLEVGGEERMKGEVVELEEWTHRRV
ncbi:hypothetical protein P7C70_g696, partial [Phenoliferia sp. Uapishka_3]